VTAPSTLALISWPSDEAIRAAVEEILQREEAPGAIVRLSAPGLTPWEGTFGLANTETGSLMNVAMHGRIGSITKTMIATLILQLVDEGALGLDDTLAATLPTLAHLPNAETITIRNLLTMRSGLYNYTEEPGLFDSIVTDSTRIWTPAELIAVAAAKPANFAPGTQFEYSNTNYIILGEIIGQLTNTSVESRFQERLVDRFDLTETSWPSDATLPAPFADGYSRVPIEGPSADAPPDGPTKVILATEVAASAGGAAGAVISTVADMDRWISILLDGEAISAESSQAQQTMLPILKPDGEPSGFGYGMGIADFFGVVGHNGGIDGFQSFAGRIMALGVNVSVIVNINYGLTGAQPADAIAFAVRKILTDHAAIA
jgi:D-alanyl-D-alanine carboxypeptidase